MLQQANGRENVLVVGHNPNLQFFLGALAAAARHPRTPARSPPSACAKAHSPGCPSTAGPATLINLIDPRLTRALYNISTRAHRRKPTRKAI